MARDAAPIPASRSTQAPEASLPAQASPGGPRPVLFTDLALPGRRQGKVRDVYDLPNDRLLIIASDRISAFDVVMPTPIAGKGALLTDMAVFWLRFVEARQICPTHLISTDEGVIPESAFEGSRTRREDLAGRIMITKRCRVVPIECVVRGYLEGSGWKEYQQSGSVCGVSLPRGLRQCDKLPEPIFTPATKEEGGRHDENISFERACAAAGKPLMEALRRISLSVYCEAAEHALARGIIIADTKFEFGLPTSTSAPAEGAAESAKSGEAHPILIDEALTPDSSRFWPADTYQPGRPQRSYDKQFLREYLEELVTAGAWNKQAPGPELPVRIVEATREKYEQARSRLLT